MTTQMNDKKSREQPAKTRNQNKREAKKYKKQRTNEQQRE